MEIKGDPENPTEFKLVMVDGSEDVTIVNEIFGISEDGKTINLDDSKFSKFRDTYNANDFGQQWKEARMQMRREMQDQMAEMMLRRIDAAVPRAINVAQADLGTRVSWDVAPQAHVTLLLGIREHLINNQAAVTNPRQLGLGFNGPL